ncbi:MAG: ABC transporter substrate-binding protein [Oscillospiraceae bacterium]|nr:ABC transporter substrate-binding protein [Oscillospiraceae bacterium]
MKYRIILCVIFALLLTSCGSISVIDEADTPEEQEQLADELPPKTEIIIGATGIAGVFSPFFAESAGDIDVMRVINLPLVSLDRQGEPVMNGITGETRFYDSNEYNYTGAADIVVSNTDESTIFNFKLRDDLFFSDGTGLTADDLIFTLYALCDVDFAAFNELAAVGHLPIEGLEYYRANADPDAYATYAEIAANALEFGFIYDENDLITREQHADFYGFYNAAWFSHVNRIVAYCTENYAEFAHLVIANNSPDSDNLHELQSHEGLQVALAMLIWKIAGFEELTPAIDELDAIYGNFISVSGRQWNMRDEFPTVDDFYREFFNIYNGDLAAYINAERITEHDDPVADAVRLFIAHYAEMARESDAETELEIELEDESEIDFESELEDEPELPTNTGRDYISGIRKLGDYEVEVVLQGQIPSAIFSFTFPIAPLHYYGDLSFYDYDNNSFGFTRGELSAVRAKNHAPLGAGPYKLIELDETAGITVFMEANAYYYKGVPYTLDVIFRETAHEDLVFGAARETLDIVTVAANHEVSDEINAYLSSGIDMQIQSAAFGSLGYIGFNTRLVNVRDGDFDEDSESDEDEEVSEILSEESVYFRKGIAVIFAAYRDITIEDAFGTAATIAEYPVSGVSWVAPNPDTAGFSAAYSTAIDGTEIYTDTMSEAVRHDAARRAALAYFEAAGCELNLARTAIAEFPDGIKTDYEIYITGGGEGKHPSFLLLNMATETLRAMGVRIAIVDVSSQGEMFDAVINDRADMWCAAFTGSVLPELDRRFSSSGAGNLFKLQDERIDLRIALAGAAFSRDLYLSALEAVRDAAVCVPVYQRQMYFIFSPALDMSSIAGNLTAHYNIADVIWEIVVK